MTDDNTPATDRDESTPAPPKTAVADPSVPYRAAAEEPRTSRTASAGLWLAGLALLGLLGIGAVGFLGFSQLQGASLLAAQRGENLSQRVADLSLASQARSQWQTQISEQWQDQQRQLRELSRQLDSQAAAQAQADKALSQLSARVQGGQNAWQLAEIEHLLLIANDRLQLARDVPGAGLALRLADTRLARLSDPRWLPVRAALSAEIARLDALPKLDLPALALQLGSLTEQVETLPIRESGRGIFRAQPAPARIGDDGTPWHQKLLAAVSDAIGSLVTVRRDVERREPLLPPDQEFYLRQNLRMQLESARLAALQQDPASYQLALRQAQSWLQTYFDAERAGPKAVLEKLRAVENQPLTVDFPDISGSLRALRAAEAAT